MDLGELHHRLCKKIAQLTKVIFFLNTKNDEYESNLKAVVVAYESEMDQIVKEYLRFLPSANSIIQTYRDHIEKMGKNDDVQSELKALQDKVQVEKQASQIEFSAYKKKCEEKEQ